MLDYVKPSDEEIRVFLEKEESRRIKKREYKYLISLVGFSPSPVIFFNKLIEPERHFFVYTEESEAMIDVIVDRTELIPSRYDKRKIKSANPTDIYKKIKEILMDLPEERYREILIDITGGKKAMSAAAALVGYLMGIDVGYIDFKEYSPQNRKPVGGTEYPIILENPLEVFGDIEIREARRFFEACDFERALCILGRLRDSVPNVREIEKYYTISKIYKHWNDFDIERALNEATKFIQQVERGVYALDSNLKGQIERHIELFKRILDASDFKKKSGYGFYIPLNFYFSAFRYARNEKYDLAVFLMYRTIESIEQIRLKDHGIDHSNALPDQYERNNVALEAYEKINRELYKDLFTPRNELPRKIGLMDGYVILKIIGDKIVDGISLENIKFATQERNESVYAHGLKPLRKKAYDNVKKVSTELIKRLLTIKGAEELPFYEKVFRFPQW